MDTVTPKDPRVTGPRATIGVKRPRCDAIEPESLETCHHAAGHEGPHEAWTLTEWGAA